MVGPWMLRNASQHRRAYARQLATTQVVRSTLERPLPTPEQRYEIGFVVCVD